MRDGETVLRRALVRLNCGAALLRAGGGCLLYGKRGPKTPVPAALIDAALRGGLLCETVAGITLTEAGRRWLTGGFTGHQELTARLIKDDGGRERFVMVNAAESPLTLLRRRGQISALQCEAGEKLRRDYTLGQLTPRMGVDYSMPAGHHSHGAALADTVIAARQRFGRALQQVGPGLREVLFDACCYLTSLDDCEKARNWPRGSAKIVLALALDRLAAHYGMIAAAPARLRSWSADRD